MWESVLYFFEPVNWKRLQKVNIGCCSNLAVQIQSVFYEYNFYFYWIQPWVFLLLSNVNIQVKSHFAIFEVPFVFFIVFFCFKFLCSEWPEYRTVWGIAQHCSICILELHNNSPYQSEYFWISHQNPPVFAGYQKSPLTRFVKIHGNR